MKFKNFLACLFVFIIHSAYSDETKLSVNINDSRVGYLAKTVKSNDDCITSIDTLSIQVKKTLNSSEKSIITSTFKEDLEGNLLYLSRKVEIPNANSFDDAYVKNGKFTVKTNVTGNTTVNISDVPPKGFLSQSACLKEFKSLAKRISSNEVTVGSLKYYTWNFPLMRAEQNKVSLQRINTGTDEGGWLVRQKKLAIEEGGDLTTSVYDHNWKLKRITTALLDMPAEFKLCNSECTDERVKPLNHLTALYIASPYKISDSTLKKRLRFTITGPAPLINGIPNTKEQKVKLIDFEGTK